MIRLRPSNRMSNIKVQPYYDTATNQQPQEKKFVSPLERGKRLEKIINGKPIIFYG